MNNNIKELERMLKNIVYAEILNYPRFIKQSTNDVWGKYVIRTHQNTNGEYQEDRNELENWYCYEQNVAICFDRFELVSI